MVNENKQVYTTIKVPLKSVLKDYSILHPIIDKNVVEMNQLVTLGYQFIRLYLLDKVTNNMELPVIDKDFVSDVLRTIGTFENNTVGKHVTFVKNLTQKDNIKTYYDTTFSKLTNIRISCTNKSYCIQKSVAEMIRCIETNTSTHFVKHLFKYINCLFKQPEEKIIKQEKDIQKRKELYKQLNKEIRDLKSDLINNEIRESDEKYHKWIRENRKFLYPVKIKNSVAYDVKVDPSRYIQYSIYINSKIEEITYVITRNKELIEVNCKPYQIIPQRNSLVPKNIILDTKAVVEIGLLPKNILKLNNLTKTELMDHTKEHKPFIWDNILDFQHKNIRKIYKNNKKYVFYNQITTDGFSCSLLYILDEFKDKPYGAKLPKYDDTYNFRNIEKLTNEECKTYLDKTKYKLVSLDPGKKRIMTIIDEKNTVFKYSASQRHRDTYAKRSNYILKHEKLKCKDIIEQETILSKYSSKTLNIDKFKQFIIEKNKVNTKIRPFYECYLFRKLSFRRYVRTKQSEAKILRAIKNKFLKKNSKRKLLICHGDYSRTTQMKGCISTPNIGMKKLLASQFEIVDVNEYNTSKLYNKTFTPTKNVTVKNGKGKAKHLHEILTLKEETERCIFINRDVNACKNILMLSIQYLKYQTRPKEFSKPKQFKINDLSVS